MSWKITGIGLRTILFGCLVVWSLFNLPLKLSASAVNLYAHRMSIRVGLAMLWLAKHTGKAALCDIWEAPRHCPNSARCVREHAEGAFFADDGKVHPCRLK